MKLPTALLCLLFAATVHWTVTPLQAQSASRGGAPTSQPIYTQPNYQQQPIYRQPLQQNAQPAGSTMRSGRPAMVQRSTQGSTTKSSMNSHSQVRSQTGSQTRDAVPTVGLDGYCPVCIVEMKKWVHGEKRWMANYDGKTYFFPGEKQLKMFRANPTKYVPALGGDCTVCLEDMQQRMPGSVRHSAMLKGKLYLFPGEKQKQAFLKSPAKYHQTELALDGKCAVCQVEMGQAFQGKEAISTYHDGLRYLFPTEKQRQMFLANPKKYAAAR